MARSNIKAISQKRICSEEKDLEQRNKLLEMVKNTAEILLSTDRDNLEETLLGAMDIMARCVNADRMHIFRKQLISGKPRYVHQCEWLNEIGRAHSLREKAGYFDIQVIPKWDQYFSAGREINGPLSSLSEEEQKIISPYGVFSILAIPLYLQQKIWGFVSFDDCIDERTFSDHEVNMLRSGSLLLANSIVRHNNKIIIDSRMKQQEFMSLVSKSFIKCESIDKLINEALEQLGMFMGVTRTCVTKTDNAENENLFPYSWHKPGVQFNQPNQTEFKKIIGAEFPKFISATGQITVVCCNDTMKDYSGKYKTFHEAGIKSFIWTPVYVDGYFWGMISAEDSNDARTWTESDIQLVETVSSAISGASAREAIDRERDAALEQAIQASRAKGNFLANMSHEMRTPMNAIIGMTSIGKASGSLEKKDYAFERIENASNHLLGVINDILDMSKIEADKL
jgi:GAF domain-containing protein